MAGLELQRVVKRFGPHQVIHGIDLAIDPGDFVVFVGPSGRRAAASPLFCG
jgi:ABC-type sugar transport system ATPase subunit